MRFGGIPILLALALLLVVPVLAQDTPAEKNTPAETDTAQVQGPHPTLVMASLDHDFGTQKPGTPIEYSFTFKNEGDADLVIQSVKASCGCTTASYDTTVAPGQTGTISLAIKKTDTYKAKIAKGATVLTNDPEHERFRLTLRADFSDTTQTTTPAGG